MGLTAAIGSNLLGKIDVGFDNVTAASPRGNGSNGSSSYSSTTGVVSWSGSSVGGSDTVGVERWLDVGVGSGVGSWGGRDGDGDGSGDGSAAVPDDAFLAIRWQLWVIYGTICGIAFGGLNLNVFATVRAGTATHALPLQSISCARAFSLSLPPLFTFKGLFTLVADVVTAPLFISVCISRRLSS